MGRKFFLTVTLLIIPLVLLVVSVNPATAVTTPTFPSCSDPQGTLKVYYENGTHGIPGDMNEYQGSDSVYILSDTTLFQCFCAEDGHGIQTNWWKFSSLTQEEIETLKRAGWTYVPNGALWDLDNVPYLAISHDYPCKEGIGGVILGVSALDSVLGLAITGNTSLTYTLVGLGSTSLLVGLLIRKRSKAIHK